MIEALELVGGQLAPPAVELAGRLDDPDTGADLGPQRASTPETVERALACAHEAWTGGGWSNFEAIARAEVLERFAQAVESRASDIAEAECIDTGVPITVTSAVASSLGGTVRAAISELVRAGDATVLPAGGRRVELLRRPWGPAALLGPWNAPGPVAISKVSNALAAGCPAILKPSEHAPGAAREIAQAAQEAGVPGGALQVVHGDRDVARRLAADPRIAVVSLTGGTAAGVAVARVAAPRMAALQLELGASNPAIVLEDADIERAALSLVDGMTKLNGQWCEAPRRVLVMPAVHGQLVDALQSRLAGVSLGPARDPRTQMGPMAHRGHLARLRSQLAALGGRPITAVDEPSGGGLFLAPRLVLGLDADAVSQEIFGPVLTVHRVSDERAALAAANSLADGLAGYVFGADLERSFALASRLNAGEIRLNGTHLQDLAEGSEQSFWGSSGTGGHGARAVFEAFRGSRIVGEDDPDMPV